MSNDTMSALPQNVLDEIRNLRQVKNLGALAVKRRIEHDFGISLPSVSTINRYLEQIDLSAPVAAVPAPAPIATTSATDTPAPATETPVMGIQQGVNAELEAELLSASNIDFSSPKAANEALKRLYAIQIQDLMRKKAAQKYVFDKDLEASIERNVTALRQLTHNEVKIQEGLRDSNKVAVSDVQFAINKIITALKRALNKICPERTNEVLNELRVTLTYIKSGVLTDEMLMTQGQDKNGIN